MRGGVDPRRHQVDGDHDEPMSTALHDFEALMYVERAGLVAKLLGVITDGWCKGHAVRGDYTEIKHQHDDTRAARR